MYHKQAHRSRSLYLSGVHVNWQCVKWTVCMHRFRSQLVCVAWFQCLFVLKVTPHLNVSLGKKKTCSQSSDIIWSLLYTSGLSATHLGFHISPRSTCEAAERSGVKWHSSLQLYLLAATAKLAQRFSLQRSSCDYSVSSVEQQGQAGTPALQSILLFNLCWKGKERIIHPLVSDQCWHCRIKPKSCASNVKTRIRMRISKNIIHHTQRRTHRGREGRSAVLKVKFVLTTMKGSHFMINNFLSNHQHILSSSLNDVH